MCCDTYFSFVMTAASQVCVFFPSTIMHPLSLPPAWIAPTRRGHPPPRGSQALFLPTSPRCMPFLTPWLHQGWIPPYSSVVSSTSGSASQPPSVGLPDVPMMSVPLEGLALANLMDLTSTPRGYLRPSGPFHAASFVTVGYHVVTWFFTPKREHPGTPRVG